MGDIKGFLKVKRQIAEYRPVCERIKDYEGVMLLRGDKDYEEQSSRCMDCGTPFCHWGCPVGNYIPEWNDLVFRGRWQEAFHLLSATNNFPEFTGRVCPAQCEYSCVLGINDEPVTIRENELAIIEHAFREGLVRVNPPQKRSGKRIAVIGSGPAGLACADQLNKAGHVVVVLEKADKIGGILRYGIPDFKLEKFILERRINLLKQEGIIFNTGAPVGTGLKFNYLKKEFDAVCLASGCSVPRDLRIAGRELKGIHFAMDYLTQANRMNAAEEIPQEELIDAKGKRVVVVGGGDTGADCVGVAHRQGASCVVQIEIMPEPQTCRSDDYPWPEYPVVLKTSSSHEEGGQRRWSVLTKKFIGENRFIKKLSCVEVAFPGDRSGVCPGTQEIEGSEFEIEADLVILALGFLHPEKEGPIAELNLQLDNRGNVRTADNFMTSQKGIFACGDMRRGQSLLVWAISEGRRAAHFIDSYLMGESFLPII